jgi:hypothetical protein
MGKRRVCPACDKPFIAGVTVMFAARTGLRRARVCKECARKGTLIVQDRSADGTLCVNCGKLEAVWCALCAVRHSRAASKNGESRCPE